MREAEARVEEKKRELEDRVFDALEAAAGIAGETAVAGETAEAVETAEAAPSTSDGDDVNSPVDVAN